MRSVADELLVAWHMIRQRKDGKAKRPTLLVVDDDENVAKTLAMVLAQSGFRTVVAHTSKEGFFAAMSNAVDLALIDVILPDVDGVETAVKLCKRLPRCKILLISGDSGTSEILERASKKGIDFPILAKPIPTDELLSTIRALLDGARR